MIAGKVTNRFKLLILLLCIISGCKTPKEANQKSSVILNLGTKPIYLSEFKYVYEKNIHDRDSLYQQQSVENYLDLFINFKLKVTEAEKSGH
ncbi:MAG: hypothetical protein HC880_12775 [Bacteroidia bacterium]|nr:hypothetical protein [Bacteroidia bacterium]